MQNLFREAFADVAAQLSKDPEHRYINDGVKKFIAASATGFLLATGAAQDAKAFDTSTFTSIIGGAIGAYAGSALTKNTNDQTARNAVLVGTGAAGVWAGQVVGEKMMKPDAPVMNQEYRSNMNPPASHDSYRNARLDAPIRSQSVQGPLLFSPESAGFAPMIASALNQGQMKIVASGQTSLNNNPVLNARLSKVTQSAASSIAQYGASAEQWEDASTLSGSQGVAARTKAAEVVAEARRNMSVQVNAYAQVRNVIAQKGYDVAFADELLNVQSAKFAEPSRYVFTGEQKMVEYRQ